MTYIQSFIHQIVDSHSQIVDSHSQTVSSHSQTVDSQTMISVALGYRFS